MATDVRFLKSVKSVNIQGCVDGGRILPDVHSTLNWLHQYNNHWIEKTGVMDGVNAHLLYDRTVVFEADGVSACIDDLKELALGVRSLGMQFTWRVALDDYVSFKTPITELIDECEIGMVAVVLGNVIDASGYSRLMDLLASSCGVQILGKIDLLVESGLLSEVCFNNRHVELVNVDTTEKQHVEVIAKTRPCEGRLSVSISATGHIFPCPYLLSAPPALAIGHMREPFSKMVDENHEVVEVLAGLVMRGPSLMPSIYEGKVEKGIPVECQLHLKRLSETVLDGKLSSIY